MRKVQWKGSKVFVTGATGLLGAHLTRILVEQGAETVVLVRDSVPRSIFFSREPGWSLQDKTVMVKGEVENAALIERIVNEYEIDTIFHLAAQTLVGTANRSPVPTLRTNIEGTWNILEAARLHPSRVKRVVIASSDKAYGNLAGGSYDEGYPLRGEHPYDVSKSCADLISRAYFVSYGVPVAVTRCGNFFGPGDLNYSRIIPGAIRDVVEGRAPVIRSDGSYIRDYIFAEDGAYAYLTLAEQMVEGESLGGAGTAGPGSHLGANVRFAGEAFNFSYGLRLTVKDVVQKVLQTMGRADLKPTILNQAKNEIPLQCLDSKKAKDQLGWAARYGFDDGLKKTVQWYVEHLKG